MTKNEIESAVEKINIEKREIEKRLQLIQSQCNHELQNLNSSWEGCIPDAFCPICGFEKWED